MVVLVWSGSGLVWSGHIIGHAYLSKTMGPLVNIDICSLVYSFKWLVGLVAENRKLSGIGLDGMGNIPHSKVCKTREKNLTYEI